MIREKHIFLIDDDFEEQELLEMAFAENKFEHHIHYFSSGKELLERISSVDFIPDYIITDLDMPGLNGIEIVKALKKNNKYKSVPIIMHSNTKDANKIKNAYSAGVNLFINKSESYTKLCELVLLINAYSDVWLYNRISKCQEIENIPENLSKSFFSTFVKFKEYFKPNTHGLKLLGI